ncbi:sulfotransferase [Cyanobium sp. ATX 6A2]|uniref:sulfotransferase family protein n=1 Tax=Cyanobium sp. ATX 6A2 TaxID=2823700 RepID=UPI0020CE9F42|nr:sulfotransferase [Cyanobium sp. ATX 6A2]MCP9887607.1 sulfotransferase [Cyanobium sp. ATX 6A2]
MRRLWRPPLRGSIHVCGCGHSGTSILTRLVGAHSRIHAIAGETGVAKKERYGRYRLALEQFWSATEAAGADLWVEKTPKHVRHLGFILGAAPASRILLICRHPLDTVASLKRRYGRLGKGLRRWKQDNGRVLHWRAHPQVLVVRYERLVQSPQSCLEEVMGFVGLGFEAEQLAYHQQPVQWYGGTGQEQAAAARSEHDLAGLSHVVHRNRQINQPLFDNTGTYRQHLDAKEIARVQRSCSRLAAALGYSL